VTLPDWSSWTWLFLGAVLLVAGILSAATADRTKDERLALGWGLAGYLLGSFGLLIGAWGVILRFFESLDS
jgi:uncharacterized membrane protein HdeD (DUF308 family)